MSALTQERRLSYAEYLALELETGVKHELYDGVALAMAGGSVAHARLVGNAYAELRAALRGHPCRAAGSEQKLFLTEAGLTTYPDAAVFCPPLTRAPPRSARPDRADRDRRGALAQHRGLRHEREIPPRRA